MNTNEQPAAETLDTVSRVSAEPAYEVLCDSNEDRGRWLEMRKLGIGASEIAAVLGVSPWSSALKLWAQKVGRIEPDDLSGNEAVFWGTQLEPAIIQGYADRAGRMVRPCGKLLRSIRWPWLLATPDAETSEDGITWWPLQIKNIGFNSADHWTEGVPDYYRVQVIQEAIVYGAEQTTAAALVAGQKLIWDDVPADEFTVRQIVNLSRDFWQSVVNEIEPKADGSEASSVALKRLYSSEKHDEVKVLPASLADFDAALQEAKERKRQAEADIRSAENAITQAIGDALGGLLPDGTLYTWKAQERAEHVVKASTFRVLRRKAAKKGE